MTSTKQKAYEGLKYRIITQQLPPGELLKDKDIMEKYGIGRTPLREVFLELQNEGLIKRIPRSGTWVAPMDFHFLKQVTEIRIGLEGIAGELAAERISEEQLENVTRILQKVTSLESEQSVSSEKLLKYESDFHNVIYASTGNPQLEKLLRNYQSVGARFWHYLVFSKEQMADQFRSQRLLLAALKRRDKKACKEITEEHIRSYMGIIDDRIDL
jgi:DNA-binding GntR family transcriptional regulator